MGTACPHCNPFCDTLPFTVRALQGRCLGTGTRVSSSALPSCSLQIRLQQLWGHSASFPLLVLTWHEGRRYHTHSCAYPPNSPFSSSDLESVKSSTGQSSDTGWVGIWAIRVRALSTFDCKELDTSRATAGKEDFQHEVNAPCLVTEKESVSFLWD